MYSSPKGELANQIAQSGADILGLFGLSPIECRGWHASEQAKVGSQGERVGRSESKFAGFTDSSAFCVPYRLNSAQFAQDILLITCIYMKFSFLCDGILDSSSEKVLAPALLA